VPTKDTLFRPTAAQTKAAETHSASKRIIDAETAERTAKTVRLRHARLERDASQEGAARQTGKPSSTAKASR
jgi:hypothetical protein